MKKLREYPEQEIRDVLQSEGWDRPLPPIVPIKPSRGMAAIFWTLRVYVAAMVLVVAYAFAHGMH